MAVYYVNETTGIESRHEAEAWAELFQLDGWETEIIDEGGGTFTLRAKKLRKPEQAFGDLIDNAKGVKGLLDFIAQIESGGNYNAYYGHAGNQNQPQFTGMLLKSVQDWQNKRVAAGGQSAAGRYQIIRTTLNEEIEKLGLDVNTERYSMPVQDKLAESLLEKRKLSKFLDGSLTLEGFGNNLAMEWAALPVLSPIVGGQGVMLKPGQSYYSGDGLNAEGATVEQFTAVLQKVTLA